MNFFPKFRQRRRKAVYYSTNAIKNLLPDNLWQNKLKSTLDNAEKYDIDYIFDRVNYYNKLNRFFNIASEVERSRRKMRGAITSGSGEPVEFIISTHKKTSKISDFNIKDAKHNTYFYDLREYLRYFNSNFILSYLFFDVNFLIDTPTIVKSRPISDDNQNSVIINLNKIRHFNFVHDKLEFKDKKNILVWRGAAYRKNRKEVVKKFYGHGLCDIGQTNKPKEDVPWQKDYMGIYEQLKNKFILCIEGNDVATNLKWTMSSNSVCMMVKPKFETWFMEGNLIPSYHYVQLKDDYSDLKEKLNYYSKNVSESLKIIKNANDYIEQFKNKKREDIISLLVLKKYFDKSKQKLLL
jgi:hypothetical protein